MGWHILQLFKLLLQLVGVACRGEQQLSPR
jgi:hypothetical protein